MTNHWVDLQNAKVFLIEGSNAAENHAMAMKWIRKAKDKGALVIHVDPRFNRTSTAAPGRSISTSTWNRCVWGSGRRTRWRMPGNVARDQGPGPGFC